MNDRSNLMIMKANRNYDEEEESKTQRAIDP